jgi:hypothetical protein
LYVAVGGGALGAVTAVIEAPRVKVALTYLVILAVGIALAWLVWSAVQRVFPRRPRKLSREELHRKEAEWRMKRLNAFVGNHTNFVSLFNSFNSADEIRAWIKTCRNDFFGEYPRDSGGFSSMVMAVSECRHAADLKEDIRILSTFWYDENKVRRGLGSYDSEIERQKTVVGAPPDTPLRR